MRAPRQLPALCAASSARLSASWLSAYPPRFASPSPNCQRRLVRPAAACPRTWVASLASSVNSGPRMILRKLANARMRSWLSDVGITSSPAMKRKTNPNAPDIATDVQPRMYNQYITTLWPYDGSNIPLAGHTGLCKQSLIYAGLMTSQQVRVSASRNAVQLPARTAEPVRCYATSILVCSVDAPYPSN